MILKKNEKFYFQFFDENLLSAYLRMSALKGYAGKLH